jgi:4-hydroxy-3-methylbut-2-enyl diphosphate reductase
VKITVAKSAGFCFGVKRALNIAYETLRRNKNVYALGDIVHNEDVAEKLRKAGLRQIKKLKPGASKIFLIRAHGSSLDIINKARRLGYKIVDATCPMVKEIHKICRSAEGSGYKIIVIGDKKHDEVCGIIGQLKNPALVIENAQDIRRQKLKKILRACAVAQSTQNLEKVLGIIKLIKPHLKELRFFNTICRPTRLKQEEIKSMPLKNEIMIIIGSKTSANTKRLYEISKSLNDKSYWVRSKKDLKPAWFKGVTTVGITAGASTPDETTAQIICRIRKIA